MQFVIGLIRVIAWLGAIGASLGLVFGLLQSLHPAMDSFSHFRVHFAVVLAVCAALLVLTSGSPVRWASLVVAVACVGWIAMLMQSGPPREAPDGDFRIVQFNLNYGNRSMARVGEALSNLDADIVALQEVTPAHEAALRGLKTYPYQEHCFFRQYVGAVSILSKFPISNSSNCLEGLGAVAAKVDLPGGAITVASIHTYWPWPHNQHAQIDRWVPMLEAIEGPVIVAGDFNAAPWSHAVTRVAEASRTTVIPGLRMTIGVSVHSRLPRVPIPIDHVLMSKDFCALSAAVGPELGSDHFPVIVEVGRKPSKRCGAG